jgi:hypothetical protein
MEEHTKNDWFSFPCGHSICAECNDKMVSHRFLSCPTCRTPREGVSQRQVEQANQARAERQSGRVGGRGVDVVFFPVEAGAADPFRSLNELLVPEPPFRTQPWDAGNAGNAGEDQDADEALARVLQAEDMLRAHMPHLRTTVALQLHGPMQELVGELLRPGSIEDFLARRDVVRRQRA